MEEEAEAEALFVVVVVNGKRKAQPERKRDFPFADSFVAPFYVVCREREMRKRKLLFAASLAFLLSVPSRFSAADSLSHTDC